MAIQMHLICLGNPKKADCAWWDLVCAAQRLFEKCLPKGHDVNVLMIDKERALSPRDVLVYVWPSDSDAVLPKKFSCSKHGNGATGWNSAEVASEIYVSGNADTNALARLIFHEVLHNKLQWKDKKLHDNGGLAGETVGPALTQSDITLMRQALQTPRRQWTGGFLSTYDPLNDMGL